MTMQYNRGRGLHQEIEVELNLPTHNKRSDETSRKNHLEMKSQSSQTRRVFTMGLLLTQTSISVTGLVEQELTQSAEFQLERSRGSLLQFQCWKLTPIIALLWPTQQGDYTKYVPGSNILEVIKLGVNISQNKITRVQRYRRKSDNRNK